MYVYSNAALELFSGCQVINMWLIRCSWWFAQIRRASHKFLWSDTLVRAQVRPSISLWNISPTKWKLYNWLHKQLIAKYTVYTAWKNLYNLFILTFWSWEAEGLSDGLGEALVKSWKTRTAQTKPYKLKKGSFVVCDIEISYSVYLKQSNCPPKQLKWFVAKLLSHLL